MKVLDFGLAKLTEAGGAGQTGRAGGAGQAGGFAALSQSPTTPVQLVEAPSYVLGASGDFAALLFRTYDVSPDGRRFLMIKNANTPGQTSAPRIVVVRNWFEELERRVPATR